MACIHKLSVSGIRSFDPEDRAVITFFPLTLILGQNGAGKTTLIECLRYAATNEFPPHTNKGKTWIHDLHFSKSHTHRGQVKLSFTDIHGTECVITRSLELTAKRDRSGKAVPQMRTLDAVIKRGEETIVSTKCIQIDTAMLDLIGVSKAVLSDVIFCHQEDSNWPLSESKVLKEKFDQLFGSAGYVKALKKIKDERTQYMKCLAQIQGEVNLFSEHKSQAEKYSNDLDRYKALLATYKDNTNKLNEELGPIKKELESLAVKEKAIVDVERVISGLQGEMNEQKKSIEYLKSNIRETFEGNKEELKEKIANFANENKEKGDELKTTETELEASEEKLRQSNARLNRCSINKGKFEAKQAKFAQDKKKFQSVKQKLVDEGLSGLEGLASIDVEANTDAALADIQTSVDSQKTKIEGNLRNTLRSFEKSLRDIDRELDDLKSKKSKLEQSIEINTESIEDKRREASQIEDQLKEISKSSSQLKKISSELEEKKIELRNLESEYDLVKMKSSIEEIYEDLNKLKNKIDGLNSERDFHIAQNEARAVLQVHQKNQEKEQDNLSSIYSEHSNLLMDLGIEENDPDKSFVDELKNKIRAAERKLKTKEASRDTLTSDRRKLETQLEMVKMKYENCKKEIKEKEAKLKTACGSTPFEQMLNSVDSELKTLRSKSATSSGAETVLSEYSIIIENEAKCPVCETDLKSNSIKVKENLVKKIRQLPLEAKKVNEELIKKEKLHEKLLGLKSDYESLNNNKEAMPKLKQEVLEVQQKVEEIVNTLQTQERELKKEKTELDRLRSAEPQAISFDNSVRSLQEIESRISKCQSELGSVGSTLRSLDDVRGELEEFTNDTRQLEDDLKRLQDEKDKATKMISEVKEEILELEGLKLKLEKGQSKQVALTEKCAELRKQANSLEKDAITSGDEIKSIEPQLKEVSERKRSVVEEKESKRKELESIVSKLNRYLDEFATIGEDISSYLMDDIDSQLQDLLEEFNQTRRDINQINENKSELSKVCHKLRKEINEAELGERNLKDNLELLERIEKMSEYERKLAKEKEKRGAADSVALLRKKSQLEKQYQEKYQQLQQLKGKQEPVVSQIGELERDLNSEKYRKARENLQSKLVELVEMETICDDLNKLYRALDHSVMVYHKKKMDEINRLLADLWKSTYKGGDIEFIKIDSDSDTERSASDKRRSFNYRVVMVRDGVEMDMRGRCSAGQKVIASLLIRLTLSEIFSVLCGILTLDEPTTNLDHENIEAFAETISGLVKLHRNHRFQLVIITHDDRFIQCLRDADCEYYYEVYKDERGNSKIGKCSVRERED